MKEVEAKVCVVDHIERTSRRGPSYVVIFSVVAMPHKARSSGVTQHIT
jgi:hypothetical protein